MIIKVGKLREVMPQYNFFGGNNWDSLDKSKDALQRCLELDDFEIEDKAKARADILEEDGGDSCDDPVVSTYDWVLGNTDDAPADDESIENFTKKRKEGK